MDIRGPRLRKPSDEALHFTSSMASDGRIARHVIRVNLAHMLALARAKEVNAGTASKCIRFLLSASPAVNPDTEAEDYHQQLEQEAVDSLGVETAGFLNYGKSRNDQVATAIRMELRLLTLDLLTAILTLQHALLDLAKKEGETMMPGYTHLQRAQPVTLAHHLLAYFDSFQRDAERLTQLYPRINLSPMGSAALAGTSVGVDRSLVAELLGFSAPVRNSIDAVSSRDFAAEAASCAALTMMDASRLAEELILWSSREFGFVEFADAYSASSSIMPQKKNPVTAEIVRAKSGSVLGSLVSIHTILKALPYTYNLDLQELTPHLWRAFDDSISSVNVLAGAVRSIKVNAKAMQTSVAGDTSTAVGLANYLVAEEGLSFRQAHAIVGELVRSSIEKGISLPKAAATYLPKASSKFGKKLTITEGTAEKILNPKAFLTSISTQGGGKPSSLPSGIVQRRNELSSNLKVISARRASLNASQRKLNRTAKNLSREVKTKI